MKLPGQKLLGIIVVGLSMYQCFGMDLKKYEADPARSWSRRQNMRMPLPYFITMGGLVISGLSPIFSEKPTFVLSCCMINLIAPSLVRSLFLTPWEARKEQQLLARKPYYLIGSFIASGALGGILGGILGYTSGQIVGYKIVWSMSASMLGACANLAYAGVMDAELINMRYEIPLAAHKARRESLEDLFLAIYNGQHQEEFIDDRGYIFSTYRGTSDKVYSVLQKAFEVENIDPTKRVTISLQQAQDWIVRAKKCKRKHTTYGILLLDGIAQLFKKPKKTELEKQIDLVLTMPLLISFDFHTRTLESAFKKQLSDNIILPNEIVLNILKFYLPTLNEVNVLDIFGTNEEKKNKARYELKKYLNEVSISAQDFAENFFPLEKKLYVRIHNGDVELAKQKLAVRVKYYQDILEIIKSFNDEDSSEDGDL
jgi:predicted DNA binding CopG/RHH family protein